MLKSLQDAFEDELKDILHAEKQLTKALPKMAKAAASPKLRAGFEEHLKQTQEQINRLEQVFALVDKKPTTKVCKAMQGLVEEGSEIMEEKAEPAVMDALLIAAAQKIEHYEIATYGTLCTWADLLGLDEAHELLGQNLDEEEETDVKLSDLAKLINEDADSET